MQSDSDIISLGMGGSSDVSFEELVSLAESVLFGAGLKRPDVIATIATKQGDPVWLELAQHFDCGLRFFDAARLEQETPRLKLPSQMVFNSVGCHGVAESAALAAAGAAAELLIEKTAKDRATAAIAVTRSV